MQQDAPHGMRREVDKRSTNIPALPVVYVLFIFVCGLTPFTFSIDPLLSLSSLYDDKFDTHSVFWRIPAWDVFSNILLYVPFGFLFVTLPAVSQCGLTTKLFLSAVSACALSFTIESCQLFLPRAPSMVDIFLNTVGGTTGTLLAFYVYAPLNQIAHRCWLDVQRSRWLSLFVTVYVMAFLAVSVFPLPLSPNFSNWDPDYTFQLGNEANLGRPWLGKMFLVAIYDRSLDPTEILTNFKAGPSLDSQQNRIHEGLVAFYSFKEGLGTIVHDHSTHGRPLNLRIRHPEKIKWLRPNGVEFLGNTIIDALEFERKFYTSNMYSMSELTLEVWIAPAHLKQDGPARIISYSRDASLRNFTLGQAQKNVVFRIRTPLSGLNGNRPQLKTSDDPLTGELQHLVATYRIGIESLHVNGQVEETIVLDRKRYTFEVLDERVGLKYRWAYWFLVIFPVGFFSYILFARIRNSGQAVFLSLLIALTILAAMEWLQVMTLGKEMDFQVLAFGTGVVLLSIFTSAILSRSVQVS